MKRLLRYSLAICAALSTLSALACRITIVNNVNKPVVVIDAIEGATYRFELPVDNAAAYAQNVYASSSFVKNNVDPGESVTVGSDHVHARFLLGVKEGGNIQWYQLSQYQCTGHTHETLQATQIINNNYGELQKYFGTRKL